MSFAGWHAEQDLTLGTSMLGNLDEARTYERALSADEVGSLSADPATLAATPATTATASVPAVLDEPDPYEVNYRHFTLNSCRTEAPAQVPWHKHGIWTDATVFSGCAVRWFGVSMWVPDFDGSGNPLPHKKRAKMGDGADLEDLVIRSTVVANTYLGTRDGTSIRNAGSDGVTGPLTPKEISMWIQFDTIDYDWAAWGNAPIKLTTTVKSDGEASNCTKTVNGDRQTLVKDWNPSTIRCYRFKSESSSGAIRRCSFFPWVTFDGLSPDAERDNWPLWGKIDQDSENGIWTPATVRCDDETLGSGSPGNWPEEKRVRYTGACIFPDVSRVYQTDVNHAKRGPVAAHIWAAFNTAPAENLIHAAQAACEYSVFSAYVQAGDSPCIGDRIRDCAQWGCLGQGLVGSVLVVEPFVLAQGMPEVAFVPEQAAVQEFVAAGLHPSLHDRVHTRNANAGEHRADTGLSEDLIDERGELPIPIPDQITCPAAGVLQVHHEILDRLDDPGCGRMSGDAEDADAPGGVLDDGQDVLALPIEGDGLDEVAAQERVRLGAQEVGPGG